MTIDELKAMNAKFDAAYNDVAVCFAAEKMIMKEDKCTEWNNKMKFIQDLADIVGDCLGYSYNKNGIKVSDVFDKELLPVIKFPNKKLMLVFWDNKRVFLKPYISADRIDKDICHDPNLIDSFYNGREKYIDLTWFKIGQKEVLDLLNEIPEQYFINEAMKIVVQKHDLIIKATDMAYEKIKNGVFV